MASKLDKPNTEEKSKVDIENENIQKRIEKFNKTKD